MLDAPRYIADADIAVPALNFTWVTSDIRSYYLDIDEALFDRLNKLSDTGCMGLTLAIAEWIVHRFDGQNDDPIPLQFVEAGWASLVYPAYCVYTELPDDDWRGPVREPLNMTVTIVNDGIFCRDENPDPAVHPGWLRNLARRVLDDTTAFDAWFEACVERLETVAPAVKRERGMFDDMAMWDGAPLPRQAFDPAFPYKPEDGPGLVDEFLKSLDPDGNEFLRSVDEMTEAFADERDDNDTFNMTPYRYTSVEDEVSFGKAQTEVEAPVPATTPGTTFDFYSRPDFIPESVVGAPLDFVWKGAQAHIGPVEQVTPLMEQIWGVTTCAEIGMCAGVMLWVKWRLDGFAEVDHDLELAEASFAYCVDWRYLDRDGGPKGKPPDQPPAMSAAMKVNSLMRRALDMDEYWYNQYQPVSETFHSAHIVRHILPNAAKRVFDNWLKVVSDRLRVYFPKPGDGGRKFAEFESREAYRAYTAPHRGVPVPPQLLDPSFDYNPEDREALVAKFLSGLDPSRNRYLHPRTNAGTRLRGRALPDQLTTHQ